MAGTIRDRIAYFLFQYHITPHTTTGVLPAELLIGCRLRTRLDLLKPDLQQKVHDKQLKQKQSRDKHCRAQNFFEGRKVFVKNHGKGNKWLPGQICQQTGPVSFKVQLRNGKRIRCHQDHIRSRECDSDVPDPSSSVTSEDDWLSFPSSEQAETCTRSQPNQIPGTHLSHKSPQVRLEVITRRYPSRVRRPPERF